MQFNKSGINLTYQEILVTHTPTQLCKWHCCAPVIKNQHPTTTIPH